MTAKFVVERVADFRAACRWDSACRAPLLGKSDQRILRRGIALRGFRRDIRCRAARRARSGSARESAASRATASGASRNSRAISRGDFRCRSALASSRRPAASSVTMLADAGDDVLQRAPFGRVVEHVVDGDQRHAGVAGDCGKPRQPARCRRRDRACWRRARRNGATRPASAGEQHMRALPHRSAPAA